jgi:Secretion system C-terminal sorting domain/Secretory lipase
VLIKMPVCPFVGQPVIFLGNKTQIFANLQPHIITKSKSFSVKKILLLSLLACLVSSVTFCQVLVSSTYLGHKTKQQLQSQYIIFPITNGVDYYKITYTTPDVQGNPSVASGLMAIPDDTTKIFPLLCYQHGTSSSRTDVPSNVNGESALPILFAGLGFVTVTPDYLGLGDSPGFHPYVHAATEASAGADALRAAVEYADAAGLCHDSRLFLTGYSQGGHSSAALHRLLEGSAEFNVVAGAHLSGPYSISGVMRDLLFSDEPYSRPAYLINTMFSYQYVYGNLYNDIVDAVKPAYVAKCNEYYNGQISLTQLNDFLVAALTANEGGPIASRAFLDGFKAEVEADPNHPVNLALADNDVDDWAAAAPTRLYYCTADDQVPFENSLVAEAALIAAGAANLDATDVGPNLDHVGCVTPALINTVFFFSPIQGALQPCTFVNATLDGAAGFETYPNPAGEVFFVKNFPSNGQLRMVDLQGRVQLRQPIAEGDNEIWTGGLQDGLYFLEVQGKSGSFRTKLMIAN